jgi:hypothetical protein
MTYWAPLVVDGVIYDLSHLEPFQFHVAPRGMTDAVTLNARFHDHCFTEVFDPLKHQERTSSSQYSAHEKRAFDPARYELSKLLPEFVKGLGGKRIASSRYGNLVRLELASGAAYAIFFTLRRVNDRRVDIFVVSAFQWSRKDKAATTGGMNFDVALAKTIEGKPLKFPHK